MIIDCMEWNLGGSKPRRLKPGDIFCWISVEKSTKFLLIKPRGDFVGVLNPPVMDRYISPSLQDKYISPSLQPLKQKLEISFTLSIIDVYLGLIIEIFFFFLFFKDICGGHKRQESHLAHKYGMKLLQLVKEESFTIIMRYMFNFAEEHFIRRVYDPSKSNFFLSWLQNK